MINMRRAACAVAFISSVIWCGQVSAGPIDNANEFVAKAVSEAEEGTNAPADQSPATPAISWEGQGSGTDAAVNIDTAADAGKSGTE